jgi:all-trans-retinol 13,14-reductase
MKLYSTGALTPELRAEQDRIYQGNPSYDYVIIGTGMAALVSGALLAHAGYRVCMLEAHDIPGGYAHTFAMNDFHFCAQVHYIWGCAPKQPIYEFLRHLGLEEELTFVAFDPEGYDQMRLPDGKRIKIPFGYEKLIANMEVAYPGQGSQVRKFVSILEMLQNLVSQLPKGPLNWWDIVRHSYRFFPLLRYKSKTLQDVFDEAGLSQETQAALAANTGDFMCPPAELSIFAYLALFNGYNQGAYYPTKHFKYYVERLAGFIKEHPGCHIFYETEVTGIHVSGSGVTHVTTKGGKAFKAEKFICNMDPQKAASLIGKEQFPSKEQEALSYSYSPSSLMIYLGIKGLDLRDYGFGNHNIWHLEQWDINKAWNEMRKQDYAQPWMFLSTPTLHTSAPGVAPEGCSILEMGTVADYGYFKQLYDHDASEYRKQKRLLADRLMTLLQEKYIPTIEKHIALKVVGSPVSNETFCYAPYGNCYGSDLTPRNVGLNRLTSETPWGNLFWCNASSGYPSIYATTVHGMELYMKLTGDSFFDSAQAPSTEEAIQYAKGRVQEYVHR